MTTPFPVDVVDSWGSDQWIGAAAAAATLAAVILALIQTITANRRAEKESARAERAEARETAADARALRAEEREDQAVAREVEYRKRAMSRDEQLELRARASEGAMSVSTEIIVMAKNPSLPNWLTRVIVRNGGPRAIRDVVVVWPEPYAGTWGVDTNIESERRAVQTSEIGTSAALMLNDIELVAPEGAVSLGDHIGGIVFFTDANKYRWRLGPTGGLSIVSTPLLPNAEDVPPLAL